MSSQINNEALDTLQRINKNIDEGLKRIAELESDRALLAAEVLQRGKKRFMRESLPPCPDNCGVDHSSWCAGWESAVAHIEAGKDDDFNL